MDDGQRPASRDWRALLIGIVLLATLGGCAVLVETNHRGDSGPLSVGTGGMASLYPPPEAPWTATLGGTPLCTRTGEPIVIESVTYTYEGLVSADSIVRQVSGPVPEGGGPRSPVISMVGSPGSPADGRRVAGRLSDPEGFVVTRDCDDDGPEAGFDELMTVVRVPERGGKMLVRDVTYRSGGDQHRLRTRWPVIFCGSDRWPGGDCPRR